MTLIPARVKAFLCRHGIHQPGPWIDDPEVVTAPDGATETYQEAYCAWCPHADRRMTSRTPWKGRES